MIWNRCGGSRSGCFSLTIFRREVSSRAQSRKSVKPSEKLRPLNYSRRMQTCTFTESRSNVLRGILVWRYQKFEVAFPAIQLDIFDGIHDRVERRFLKYKELAEGISRIPLGSDGHDTNCPCVDRPKEERRSLPAHQCPERESLMNSVAPRTKAYEQVVMSLSGESPTLRSRKRKKENDDHPAFVRPLRVVLRK